MHQSAIIARRHILQMLGLERIGATADRAAPFTAFMQHGWLKLETGPGHQQNSADCHKENARPVRSEPQESHAAPGRLQSVANRAGGFRATKRSPPNSTACHVQDSAENEQRAKSHQILASQFIAAPHNITDVPALLRRLQLALKPS